MSDFRTLDVNDLEFDEQNPRLPTRLLNTGSEDIIKYLAR